MIPTSFDKDGVVTLEHEGHRFSVSLIDHSYTILPDGSSNHELLATPQLICSDPGCAYTCRTYFPLAGNADAQAMHVLYRSHTEHHGDLKKAARAVADELGDRVRFDQHPLLRGVLSESKRR